MINFPVIGHNHLRPLTDLEIIRAYGYALGYQVIHLFCQHCRINYQPVSDKAGFLLQDT